MAIAQSKVTTQGQISVPAEVRKRLGLGPGSVLEWDDRGGEVIVRKAARFTSAQVHDVLFPGGTERKAPIDVKAAIRARVRRQHARD